MENQQPIYVVNDAADFRCIMDIPGLGYTLLYAGLVNGKLWLVPVGAEIVKTEWVYCVTPAGIKALPSVTVPSTSPKRRSKKKKRLRRRVQVLPTHLSLNLE